MDQGTGDYAKSTNGEYGKTKITAIEEDARNKLNLLN